MEGFSGDILFGQEGLMDVYGDGNMMEGMWEDFLGEAFVEAIIIWRIRMLVIIDWRGLLMVDGMKIWAVVMMEMLGGNGDGMVYDVKYYLRDIFYWRGILLEDFTYV
mgnify:CR=1 FL=1